MKRPELTSSTTPSPNYDVALIGSTGFIASWLISTLSNAGLNLAVIGRAPKLPAFPFGIPTPLWERVDYFSLAQRADASHFLHSRNCIYNSVYKGRFEENSAEWDVQGKTIAPVFSEFFSRIKLDTKRLLTFGSSEEYGVRNDDLPISEIETETPLTSHGYWKVKLKENAGEWAKKENKPTLHLRPFVVYGVHQDPHMFLGSLISTLLRNEEFKMTLGEQYRSFFCVKALCAIVQHAMESQTWPQHQVMNVSGPDYFQIRETAEKVFQLAHRGKLSVGSLPYRSFEAWHQRPNLTRLEEWLRASNPTKVLLKNVNVHFETELIQIIELQKKALDR